MKRLLLFFALIMVLSSCSSIDLTKSRIVVDSSVAADNEAADFLQRYIEKISGSTVEIVAGDTPLIEGDIIIGEANGAPSDKITFDGFGISTKDGMLRITGKDKGVVFGVAELLENYFGVNYWSPKAVDIPKSSSMKLAKDIDYISNPAFEARDFGRTKDEDLKKFIRYRGQTDFFADGMFVHTFHRMFPVSEYGKSHPEYYSFVNGKRRPGSQSQLCLANEDVFNIVVQKIDSVFKANPDKDHISISQNDSQFSYCQCEKCKALDDSEEALSASLVHFCNRLAERFPDKQISTLAYNYSVKPPKNLKPLPNVNIMLCNIEGARQLPMTELDKSFVESLEAWSKITDNFFCWDYGINFSNTPTPFPNFHILAENVQTFHKNNVRKIYFCCAGYDNQADFTELRHYMISKLYWNPYQDGYTLKKKFVDGYYQDAAPYIMEYLDMLERELLASKGRLWIYDTPASHKDGFLRPELLKVYNEIFDKAEAAVKDKPDVLERVIKSRVSLQMAELEVMRSVVEKDADDLRAKVKLFSERAKHFDIRVLGECGIHAQDYVAEYERYLPTEETSKAIGAKVEWVDVPVESYASNGAVITDGLYGGTTFGQGWIGWEGKDAEFIVDLGKSVSFNKIESDYLQNLSSWVFLPLSVTYEISADGKSYTTYGTASKPMNDGARENRRDTFEKFTVEKAAEAQYIKVKVKAVKECPSWHFGIGHTCWFFIDELSVI